MVVVVVGDRDMGGLLGRRQERLGSELQVVVLELVRGGVAAVHDGRARVDEQ